MRLHSGIGSGSLAGVHPDSLIPAVVTIPRLTVQMRSLSDMGMLRQLTITGTCGEGSEVSKYSGLKMRSSMVLVVSIGFQA